MDPMKYDKHTHTRLLVSLANANKVMTEAQIAVLDYEKKYGTGK